MLCSAIEENSYARDLAWGESGQSRPDAGCLYKAGSLCCRARSVADDIRGVKDLVDGLVSAGKTLDVEQVLVADILGGDVATHGTASQGQ